MLEGNCRGISRAGLNFLDEYKRSTVRKFKLAEAAQLVEKYGIKSIAQGDSILQHHFIEGLDMKDAVGGYLNVLFEQNPKSIGGTLPDDEILLYMKINFR